MDSIPDDAVSHPSDEAIALEQDRQVEAERRLAYLGRVAEAEKPDKLKERAEHVKVRYAIMWQWWYAYRAGGLEALKPPWGELSAKDTARVVRGLSQLGTIADDVIIRNYRERLHAIDRHNDWAGKDGNPSRKAERLWSRYRNGGKYAFVPTYDPTKTVPRLPTISHDPATYMSDPDGRKTIYRKLYMLGWLISLDKPSTAELVKRVEELVGDPKCGEDADFAPVSYKTLGNYHKAYRQYGPAGLAPQRRGEKQRHNTIPDDLVEIIQGLRFSRYSAPDTYIYTRACAIAAAYHWPQPSLDQVRNIVDQIPKPVLLLADKRYSDYNSRFEFTKNAVYDPYENVWLMDIHNLDLLVIDPSDAIYDQRSNGITCHLISIIHRTSRVLIAYNLTYNRPTQFDVAATIRDGLLATEKRPYGGTPNTIIVDNGKELVAEHVKDLCRGLGIAFEQAYPHYPEAKAIKERWYGTLESELCATLAGYKGPNVVKRNPNVRAELTLDQFESHLIDFIRSYNTRKHPDLPNQSPLEYYAQHCPVIGVDVRKLDELLMKAEIRRVHKSGIRYKNRTYWHVDLASTVGEDVIIRVAPHYKDEAPEEIVVYDSLDYLCTAYDSKSERGAAVEPEEITTGKRAQRHRYRHMILAAKAKLKQGLAKAAEISGETDGVDDLPPEEAVEDTRSKVPDTPSNAEGAKTTSEPKPKTQRNFWDLHLDDPDR